MTLITRIRLAFNALTDRYDSDTDPDNLRMLLQDASDQLDASEEGHVWAQRAIRALEKERDELLMTIGMLEHRWDDVDAVSDRLDELQGAAERSAQDEARYDPFGVEFLPTEVMVQASEYRAMQDRLAWHQHLRTTSALD